VRLGQRFNRLLTGMADGRAADANTPRDWRSHPGEVVRWEAPRDVLVPEEAFQAAIRSVAARPDGGRVFRLVNVTLVPDLGADQDARGVAVQVGGHPVGHLRPELAHAIADKWASAPGLHQIMVAGVVRGGEGAHRVAIHVWPRRRISGGLVLPAADQWEVAWPPTAGELLPVAEGGCWQDP
jgi:hypothetical protein